MRRVSKISGWRFGAQGTALALTMAAAMLATIAGPASAGVLEDGKAAYKRGDYATATSLLMPLATAGDMDAQNSIGIMYLSGHGMPEDQATALQWFTKAADQGEAEAQDHLGDMYFYGWGAASNLRTSSMWYRRSANQGYATAQASYGQMYDNGFGVVQDDVQALKWALLAIARFTDADAELRRLTSVDRDERMEKMTPAQIAVARKLAAQWRPLVWHDHVDAEKTAALALQKDDYDTAVKLYRPLAELGLADDQAVMGALYTTGAGVKLDAAEALKWFRLAALQGDPEAQDWLGLAYEEGDGVAKNAVRAYMFYSMAARPGDPNADDFGQHRDKIGATLSAEQISQARALADACITSGYQICE